MSLRSKTIDEAVAHARKMRPFVRKHFLRLWCPDCFRSRLTEREAHDYPEAILLVMRCPDCVGGDFEDLTYYDEAGAEVNYDVAEIGKRAAVHVPAKRGGL